MAHLESASRAPLYAVCCRPGIRLVVTTPTMLHPVKLGGAVAPASTIAAQQHGQEAEEEEDPCTRDRLKHLLANCTTCKFTSHAATLTSAESAAVRGVSMASGAKAMLLRLGENSFLLAVLSASKTIDFKKIIALAGAGSSPGKQRAQLATVEEVKRLTYCLPGAVPPFGSLFGIPTWVDSSLEEQGQEINFNIGLRTESCAMSLSEYLQLEKPLRGAFCKV